MVFHEVSIYLVNVCLQHKRDLTLFVKIWISEYLTDHGGIGSTEQVKDVHVRIGKAAMLMKGHQAYLLYDFLTRGFQI